MSFLIVWLNVFETLNPLSLIASIEFPLVFELSVSTTYFFARIEPFLHHEERPLPSCKSLYSSTNSLTKTHLLIPCALGSANFKEDVPIDDKFKFDDYHLDYKLLRKTIKYCFENYQEADKKFDDYRAFIALQKEDFKKSTTEIFSFFVHD